METGRLPLKDLSNFQVNKLSILNTRNNIHLLKNSKHVHTTLPSIKSLISPTPVDPYTKQLTPTTPSVFLNNIQQADDKNVVSGGSFTAFKRASEGQLSKKLQIRLQFAYYKYITNQIDSKFKDIKKKHKNSVGGIRYSQYKSKEQKRTVKRRKLLVSNGSYKNPAKFTPTNDRSFPPINNNPIAFQKFHSSIGSPVRLSTASVINDSCTDKSSEAHSHSINNAFNETTLLTTPSSKSYKEKEVLINNKIQTTPMSVKAAKSLISLFTSNRQ
ncbi:hypothetical protein Kpol_1018p15 [Vanderwaltozyma polyspora DSM 70294]|uniref:Transcription factor NRM1 n=1 Tax=Vanderwaltozyma polyspora (strain ATCC 22028 / DSM 70294 / BCRC 21397 / CBS 2163 / NBRC 10782 / NRRL Y-8283 / UCD 57-17) TaxID=436907 RepID=NRM1_VANPO|nr:uncharacterized protein Kpol_1018p15 [Vanderwaltozyma polyspora DSM 70294]A7TDL7.1 RecName: Full=Transcription factor NRM1 [Vanderwaltozyma polyspora DSM 70294]EDO19487.1 hypothetical protein Kpol_1018p15 [Vanderwaltozyma polyspora DSM 70294]